jgi:hypothetical protein
MAETISVQMRKILDAYEERVENVYEVSVSRVSREAVQRLRNTSPKKSGSYARGWTLKKVKSRANVTDVIVHNRTDYQLTHLLENGHVIRNKKGEYGRTRPIKHIAPVAEWAENELPNDIERGL